MTSEHIPFLLSLLVFILFAGIAIGVMWLLGKGAASAIIFIVEKLNK